MTVETITLGCRLNFAESELMKQAATGDTIWQNVGRATWNGVAPIGWRTTKPYEWTGSEMLAGPKPTGSHRSSRNIARPMRSPLVS